MALLESRLGRNGIRVALVPSDSIKKNLGEVLVALELIDKTHLEECEDAHLDTGASMVQVIIQKGYVDEGDVLDVLVKYSGFSRARVADTSIPPEVLDEVPLFIARLHQVLPISISGGILKLAMADPLNTIALDDVRMLTQHKVEPVAALFSELLAAIENHYKST
jgi:type IV pilus assembly protein PilB